VRLTHGNKDYLFTYLLKDKRISSMLKKRVNAGITWTQL